jgi:glycosyltransferase involved in cell wall biosynthesis
MLTLAVPIFNKAPYLPRCIDSLLNQTAGGYEILLIDDGSTDGSGAICDRYAQAHPERIRVIHKANGGLSDARNTGIEAARGEWITFPDPDDWVEPGYVEAFLSLQREYQTDLVCTGFWVDEGDRRAPGYPDGPTVTMTGREGSCALLLPPRMGGFSWNKIYCLELLQRHGLRFRSDVGAAEDLDFAYRYLQYAKDVCFCPSERTCHYDQHPGSVTHSAFSRRNLQDFRTYELLARDEDPGLSRAARDVICVTAVNHLWSMLEADGADPHAKKVLLGHIRRNLWTHLTSSMYGRGRKLQALTAAVSPRLFAFLKRKARSRSL